MGEKKSHLELMRELEPLIAEVVERKLVDQLLKMVAEKMEEKKKPKRRPEIEERHRRVIQLLREKARTPEELAVCLQLEGYDVSPRAIIATHLSKDPKIRYLGKRIYRVMDHERFEPFV